MRVEPGAPADSSTPPTTFDSSPSRSHCAGRSRVGRPDIAATGSGWPGVVAAGGWAWLVWAAGSACGPARSPADSSTPPTTFDSLAQPIPLRWPLTGSAARHRRDRLGMAGRGPPLAAGRGWSGLPGARRGPRRARLPTRGPCRPHRLGRPADPRRQLPASLGCSGDAAVESGGWRRSPSDLGRPPGSVRVVRRQVAALVTRVAHPRASGPVSSRRPWPVRRTSDSAPWLTSPGRLWCRLPRRRGRPGGPAGRSGRGARSSGCRGQHLDAVGPACRSFAQFGVVGRSSSSARPSWQVLAEAGAVGQGEVGAPRPTSGCSPPRS